MSDDISMGALSGSIAERSRAAIAAGCDVVLHCNGKLDEMQAVAAAVPMLGGEAAARRQPHSAAAAAVGRATSRRCARNGPRCMNVDADGRRGRQECDRMTADEIKFEADLTCAERPPRDEPALVVDVEGFEGPLDLLLALARQQKVDLAKISILALADQYLAFIEEARKLRLELAADYLVMAAWLAYLEVAAVAARSHTRRRARARRIWRPRWRCGSSAWKPSAMLPSACSGAPSSIATCSAAAQPEPIAHIKHPQWSATLYDLLSAYAQQRQQTALAHVRFAKRTVWSLAEAREALERLIGQSTDWARLDEYLIAFVVEPSLAADRVRVELRLDAGTGARGADGDAPAGGVRAALRAQARCRRKTGWLPERRGGAADVSKG